MNLKFVNLGSQVEDKFVIKEKGGDKLIEYQTNKESETSPVVTFDTEDDAKHFIVNMLNNMIDTLEVIPTHTAVFEQGAILMRIIKEEGDAEYES